MRFWEGKKTYYWFVGCRAWISVAKSVVLEMRIVLDIWGRIAVKKRNALAFTTGLV